MCIRDRSLTGATLALSLFATNDMALVVMLPLSAAALLRARWDDLIPFKMCIRDRSFYMRSIVGTGPGGFRSMRYANGPVARPLMDTSREELRAYVEKRERSGKPVACDAEGGLWREDATNAHTDRFRAYVRHEIVPRAKERNPQLLNVLGRTMNLIADEDDFMESLADDVADRCVAWLEDDGALGPDFGAGFVLAPSFGAEPLPLRRRVCLRALQSMLGPDARVETCLLYTSRCV